MAKQKSQRAKAAKVIRETDPALLLAKKLGIPPVIAGGIGIRRRRDESHAEFVKRVEKLRKEK